MTWVQVYSPVYSSFNDAIQPNRLGVTVGIVFWSRYPEIESRFSIYVGLFDC